VTAIYARGLPNLYRSEAVLQVIAQRVPQEYVRPTINVTLQARLQAIRSLILSRTRLERLILELNLYPKERESGAIMEDLVERMRSDVGVQTTQGDIFSVSYVGGDPRTVTTVADRLASIFIDESLRDRAVLAEGTDQFLESQLDEARGKLVDHEKKLEAFQRRYSGQLPSQLSSNLQAGQNLQTQMKSLTDSIDRDQERRLVLERQLNDLEAQAPVDGDRAFAGPSDAATGTTAQQLVNARKALAALEAKHLTPDHPDVRLAQRNIRDLEKQVETELLNAPVSSAPVLPAAELVRQRKVEELRATLAQLDKQSARNQVEVQRLRAAATDYQRRVEMVPTRESDLVELNRDYGTLRATYTNLLSKKEEANIAANLEKLQAGEQFKVLDPARVPTRPITNRQRIRIMGMLAGLAFGLCLIGLLEYRDATFSTDAEVAMVLSLPVLAVVPLMKSAREHKRAFMNRMAINAGLGATVVGCLAIVAYTLVR